MPTAAVCGVASWQQITHCILRANTQARCCVVVCVTVFVYVSLCVLTKICQRKVESTSLLFATSLSLQWGRVTEL